MPRLLISLLPACACLAPDVSRMDQVAQVAQSFASEKRFMGAVLVARGTEVLVSKGYGSAKLE